MLYPFILTAAVLMANLTPPPSTAELPGETDIIRLGVQGILHYNVRDGYYVKGRYGKLHIWPKSVIVSGQLHMLTEKKVAFVGQLYIEKQLGIIPKVYVVAENVVQVKETTQ